MSCISLRLRLPPARKVWKNFTSTLGKLHKIHKSKAMKKHRKHTNTSTTKPAITTTTKAPKFPSSRRFRRKRLATFRSVFNNLHKKPAPVYIDRLFKEPPCELVDHLKPQSQIAYKSRSGKTAKIRYPEWEEQVEGTSIGDGGVSERASSSSDDVWESVALGSPLMQGIDARAEEFIAKFRREMAAQDNMLTRNL